MSTEKNGTTIICLHHASACRAKWIHSHFFTRPSLKCLPGWLNFITLWGLLGYCLPRKIVLMALSALLIAKCFVCISYSWHCSWWVLQGPLGDLEENLQNMGTSKAPEKRNSAFLIRGIKVPVWSNSFSFVEAGHSAAMPQHTGMAVKISKCI